LVPRDVRSWLQMQSGNSQRNGVGSGSSGPIALNDDDEVVELKHRNDCTQFY